MTIKGITKIIAIIVMMGLEKLGPSDDLRVQNFSMSRFDRSKVGPMEVCRNHLRGTARDVPHQKNFMIKQFFYPAHYIF